MTPARASWAKSRSVRTQYKQNVGWKIPTARPQPTLPSGIRARLEVARHGLRANYGPVFIFGAGRDSDGRAAGRCLRTVIPLCDSWAARPYHGLLWLSEPTMAEPAPASALHHSLRAPVGSHPPAMLVGAVPPMRAAGRRCRGPGIAEHQSPPAGRAPVAPSTPLSDLCGQDSDAAPSLRAVDSESLQC